MPRKASSKIASPMVTTIRITKTRVNLGAMVTRVHLNKAYIIVEEDGVPIAGIMDIDEFEDYLELRDPKVRAIIARGRQEYLAGKSRPAEDLLRQLQDRKGGKITRRQDP
jgi:PHD/YefM family antitoxin component YafN of YafNO toxin-antitoxin module